MTLQVVDWTWNFTGGYGCFRGKCIDPQSPDSDQHQSSPNTNPSNVKRKDYSTKEKDKVHRFFIKFSQLVFLRNQ